MERKEEPNQAEGDEFCRAPVKVQARTAIVSQAIHLSIKLGFVSLYKASDLSASTRGNQCATRAAAQLRPRFRHWPPDS